MGGGGGGGVRSGAISVFVKVVGELCGLVVAPLQTQELEGIPCQNLVLGRGGVALWCALQQAPFSGYTGKKPMYTVQDRPQMTWTDPALAPLAHRFSPSWDHFNTGSKFSGSKSALLPLCAVFALF